jgi:hypothetical protein
LGYGTAACLIFYSWMGVTLESEASHQLLSYVEKPKLGCIFLSEYIRQLE